MKLAVVNRLAQGSTWAGLASTAGTVGLIAPDWRWESVVGVAVCSILAIILP